MVHFRLFFGLAHAWEDRVDREGDIAVHCEPGHQRIALVDHAALGARSGDFLASVSDGASGGHFQTRHQVDQRRLACAGEAQEHEELALLNLQVDVFQNIGAGGAFTEDFGDIFEFKNTHGGSQVVREGKERLQCIHHAIKKKADDADGQNRHDYLCQRLGGAVLELIPDEFAEARVLSQHFGCDQHHPADTEGQAQTGENQRQGRG